MANNKFKLILINLKNTDNSIPDENMGIYSTEKYFDPYDMTPHNLRKFQSNNF